MATAMPSRIKSLDSFRFVGALLVVIFHYALYSRGSFPAAFLNGDYPLVDLFFLLSGFVMMHVYYQHLHDVRDYVSFLQNRLARIYPLHLATFLIYLAIGIASWNDWLRVENPEKYDPQAILPNLLMTHAWNVTRDLTFNSPSWSISAEWAMYLIFPAILWLGRSAGGWVLAVLAVSIAAFLDWIGAQGLIAEWTLLTSDGGAVRALPGFIGGASVFLLLERYRPKIYSFVPAYLLFAAVVAGIFFRLDARLAILLFAANIAAAAAAEMNGAKSLLTSRVMVYLGDASYAIYMLHSLLGTILITVVAKRILGLTETSLMLYCMLFAVPANLVIAPLVYSYFERPVRRMIRAAQVPVPTSTPAPATGPSSVQSPPVPVRVTVSASARSDINRG